MAALVMGTGLGLLPVASAHGAEPSEGVDLRWQAPARCPSSARVRSQLSDALPPDAGPTAVEVEVHADDGDTLRATAVLRGTWGETTRTLESPTCETLVDALALLVSVSVSEAQPELPPEVPPPEVPALEAEPEPEPEPTEEEAPAEPAPAAETTLTPSLSTAADREPTGDPPRAIEGLARLEVRLGGGVLPNLDAGTALTFGIGRAWFRAELGAGAWLPRQREIGPDAAIELRLFSGHARACAIARPAAVPWLRPTACAGAEVGLLQGLGQGEGLTNRSVVNRAWIAAIAGPSLELRPWQRLGFVLGAELVVPTRRISFTRDGTEEIYRPAAVAGRGFAGVEVHFP